VGPSAGGPPPGSDPDAGSPSSAPVAPLDTPVLVPNTSAPGSPYAVGTVVAYLDKNHNGKLDLVADDASAYIDAILAANEDMSIVYFQGPPTSALTPAPLTDSNGHGPSAGYNLLLSPRCANPSPIPSFGESNPACPARANAVVCPPMAWLPMTTPYPLAVATDPEVALLMCSEPNDGPGISGTASGRAGPYDPAVQPAQYPTPCDPNVFCTENGQEYQYATCMQVSQGLCKGTIMSCMLMGYERPSPVPAGWPCGSTP
jgi:hypothetical protein